MTMPRYMTGHTSVRRGMFAVSLAKGQELPEWAEGLVGDHLLSDAPPAPEVVQREQVIAEPEPENDAPSMTWTAPKIRKYADEHGVDLGDATTKKDMLAAIGEQN